MAGSDELLERLRELAETAPDPRPMSAVMREAADRIEALTHSNDEPTMDMLHAALEESRRHDPPLLPPCKELWAAEIIYNAMRSVS